MDQNDPAGAEKRKGSAMQEVTPVEGMRWTFHVRSRSRPTQKPWVVDLEAYNWSGACDCEDFHFSREPDLKAGAKAGDDYRCYHILVCRSYVMEEIFPKLAQALGGPRMPTPGEGAGARTRARELIESIKTVPGLMELRQLITGRIDELTDNEHQEPTGEPDPDAEPKPQRAAQKIYHLQDERSARRYER